MNQNNNNSQDNTINPVPVQATDRFGHPLASLEFSQTVYPKGPILLQDFHMVNRLQHFDRERIPERVVHAKGGAAFGEFIVTNPDIAKFTKAKLFSQKGKKTEVAVRFSTVGGERGSADTVRDPRGFAVKFYTEEGIYDLVCNDIPVFFVRDTISFQDFIKTQKRNPKTFKQKDPDAQWDFWSLKPESFHAVMMLMSDRGIPNGFRFMHGFGNHNFLWINEEGEPCWVKYHFISKQGIKNIPMDKAKLIAGMDPDYAVIDLFEAIEKGDYPSWDLKVQIQKFDDAFTYKFDPFDNTKVLPHGDYPLIDVGTLTLNRNPINYFAEVEQLAFQVNNLVPGIEPSPDRMLQGRLFSYADTALHRLGVNYHLIPVNRPKCPFMTYDADGLMMTEDNNKANPYYFPNSWGGPLPDKKFEEYKQKIQGYMSRSDYTNDDYYTQPRNLYQKVMKEENRQALHAGILESLTQARRDIQIRAIYHFTQIDENLGKVLAEGCNIDFKDIKWEDTEKYKNLGSKK